jgi:hypothetical protein
MASIAAAQTASRDPLGVAAMIIEGLELGLRRSGTQ